MIWDLHTHLAGSGERTPEEAMARLVVAADRMAIDRLIVFMGDPFIADPSPAELVRQNDQVLRALEHWRHRAFGFVYVSPAHVEASIREIDRCVRDGPMVGLKLWVARRCDSPEADALVRHAQALKALIFQHTWIKAKGNLPGESTPSDLAALAARHPDASFVCGHIGGQWELGLRAVRSSPNVAVDLGGGDATAGIVETAVRELGAERVLYGSDAPGRSFATQLAKVFGAEISEADRRLILGENLRRLLLPILRAKGIEA
ncbi:amidohydrolase family protein [Planctomyces sp. SH-PL62]|uniref:amidohydrolase family protein n=1 Tax=Planctomyces sp. SH-PL62 TaxID=1636152 RepID=UPI00078D18D3|nr:amidohydrolase family protein [Planctomyces sp. SH-PL62]AMV37202.1 Amidohydrolase [Planctomyces sp. SH-PL62]